MITENDLLEPKKAFEQFIEKEVHETATKYFDNLVKNANIDINENQKTIEYLSKLQEDKKKVQDERRKKASQQSGLITGAVFSFIVSFVLAVTIFSFNDKGLLEKWMLPVLGIVIPLHLVGLGIFLLVYNGKKIAPIIRSQDGMIARLKKAEDEQIAIGYKQLERLNESYTWNMHVDIVNEAIPTIKLDKYFDFRRLQYLQDTFGYESNKTDDESLVHVQSGEILGNPFVIETSKAMVMGTETYHGSLTITYRVRVRDSGKNGGYHYETRTQVLHASVTKPKPYYNYQKVLYYGCEAAPDLCFSRGPTKAPINDEKELKKFINSEDKKFNKLCEQNIESGLTSLGNKKFETLFHAWNRNNEVQFRLLFTPLAQKNYLDMITSKSPYGDDFYFTKKGKLNTIITNHSQFTDYVVNPYEFKHYSYNTAKKDFVQKIDTYFKSLYFDLASLISIPLYQQYPTDDYIFRKKIAGNNTMQENEAMANAFPDEVFKPNECATDLILKTKLLKTEGIADRVSVTSYGFSAINRIDYIPVLGKDGNVHQVPVHWVEYIPVSAENEIEVIKHNCSRLDVNKIQNDDFYKDFVHQNVLGGNIIYDKSFVAFLTNQQREFDTPSFKNLIHVRKEQ